MKKIFKKIQFLIKSAFSLTIFCFAVLAILAGLLLKAFLEALIFSIEFIVQITSAANYFIWNAKNN